MRIALEAVLLKFNAKLAPGRALLQVNFDPMQEIGPKVGDGRSFVSGPFFARLRYKDIKLQIFPLCQLPTSSIHIWLMLTVWELMKWELTKCELTKGGLTKWE